MSAGQHAIFGMGIEAFSADSFAAPSEQAFSFPPQAPQQDLPSFEQSDLESQALPSFEHSFLPPQLPQQDFPSLEHSALESQAFLPPQLPQQDLPSLEHSLDAQDLLSLEHSFLPPQLPQQDFSPLSELHLPQQELSACSCFSSAGPQAPQCAYEVIDAAINRNGMSSSNFIVSVFRIFCAFSRMEILDYPTSRIEKQQILFPITLQIPTVESSD